VYILLACSSSKSSGPLSSVVATLDILHTAWLVPDLLRYILRRQLWVRRRKYYTPANQGLVMYNVLYLSAWLRLQIDTFAALEDTEQDRACAPVGTG